MIGINSNIDSKIISGNLKPSSHTIEDTFRLFLKIVTIRKTFNSDTSNDYSNYVENLKELEAKINEISIMEKKKKNIELSNTQIKFVYDVYKDDLFISILENLNIFSLEEVKLIYSLFKILKTFAKNEKDKTISSFYYNNLNRIVSNFLDNLNSNSNDFVIITVSKCIKKLSQEEKLLEKILTWENFNSIYCKSKSKKYILLQECFSIISYFIESPKVNKDYVSKLFEENEQEFSYASNNMLGYCGDTRKIEKECIEDDNYLLKRETLIMIEKILIDQIYEKFNLLYSNRVENLKTIMLQLNNKCLKIVYRAVDILYYFFVDVETKCRNIKILLHKNKNNFYQFFHKHEAFFLENSDMSYKKCFILYELERLENYLNPN